VAVRDQWREGRVRFRFEGTTWITIFPQFVNPHPAVVTDVRFRRALLHATDREAMADSLQFGMAPVGHSFVSPGQPAYAKIEARLPRYAYDARLAERLLGELGYARGTDGVLHSSSNERLEVELRTGPNEQAAKPGAAVADYWQRSGVATNYYRMAVQQQQESEYRSTFPAFSVFNQGIDVPNLFSLHSSRAPLPENRFRVPGGQGNVGRYMNPELDALIDRYFMTVPMAERTQALEQVLLHVAEQLPVMGIYYNPRPEAIADRLIGASRERTGGSLTWNAKDWDVR
jgi:peptide/nickel transport system substrate-binding protein